ncbi:MICOS complex subunit Mic10 [Ditylenchus destructor]|nr:MICOS complex subunit Mic10 [Ditylenchus destructor]
MSDQKVKAEDELGLKLDRCFADTLLKVTGGLAIGIVASLALFKSRTWPIWLGTGVGLGNGWSNCRHDLESPYLLHGKKVKSSEAGKSAYQIVLQNPPPAPAPK